MSKRLQNWDLKVPIGSYDDFRLERIFRLVSGGPEAFRRLLWKVNILKVQEFRKFDLKWTLVLSMSG